MSHLPQRGGSKPHPPPWLRHWIPVYKTNMLTLYRADVMLLYYNTGLQRAVLSPLAKRQEGSCPLACIRKKEIFTSTVA